MTGIDQIIIVDQNSFELTLSPLARKIDVFEAIIVRDKGSVGDSQARKKTQAIKEIVYCYFMEKYGTIFYRFEEDKRHSEITKRLGIEIDENDSKILDLRDFLNLSQITPSYEALSNIKESYHSSTKMLSVMRKLLERMILDLQALEWSQEEETNEKILDKVRQADGVLKDIKRNALEFDSVLKLITSLEEKVKEEQKQKERKFKGKGQPSKYEE